MVTYKREIRLWREAHPVQRALMIRDDADSYWIACQMQHSRIMNPGPAIFSDPRAIMVQRRIDVDLFVVSLHRLSEVANLAAEVADPRGVLPEAITLFSEQTAGLPLSEHDADQSPTIANVRHVLEHGQNLEIRGGLGFASGQDGWFVSYRGRMWETQELLAAAETLHAAIRKAIDPEAFSDFRGDVPYIELRDPADIIQRSDPASGILARQASAMAEIQEGLQTSLPPRPVTDTRSLLSSATDNRCELPRISHAWYQVIGRRSSAHPIDVSRALRPDLRTAADVRRRIADRADRRLHARQAHRRFVA